LRITSAIFEFFYLLIADTLPIFLILQVFKLKIREIEEKWHADDANDHEAIQSEVSSSEKSFHDSEKFHSSSLQKEDSFPKKPS